MTQELDIGTIDLDTTLLAETDVLLATQGSETPVLGDDDLLATGELVHGAAEGLDGEVTVGVTGADREQDLANVHAGNGAVGLTEGTTHTGLETIGSGTGQHLVDTDDVEGVGADTEMETFLSSGLHEVPSHIISGHSNLFPNQETYLLAQIRAASRASEDSCSYSLETMCTQVGKSSTLAFLRPRSKIRIFGSGTPRLKRDFG